MSNESNKWDAHQEFAIVVELLASSSRSKGVDAFALSLLKAERHARRIFTFLVFQSNCFTEAHSKELREILVANRGFNFSSALAGIELISPLTLVQLCGESHSELLTHLPVMKQRRNKLFHGQLTDESLSTAELATMTSVLKSWSLALAQSGASKLGYDGFASGSFFKSANTEFHHSLKKQISSTKDYSAFLIECHQSSKLLFNKK